MKKPKHWNELTEEEKKDYKKRAWLNTGAQWLMTLLMLSVLIFGFVYIDDIKSYESSCSACFSQHEGLLCTLDGNPVRLEGKALVVEKINNPYSELGGLPDGFQSS